MRSKEGEEGREGRGGERAVNGLQKKTPLLHLNSSSHQSYHSE